MKELNIKTSNFPYIFSGLFLFISIVFLIIASAVGYSAISAKISSDAYVIASKVELNSHQSNSGEGTMYSPIFFYIVDNKEYSCATASSLSWKPDINNSKIYYNSKNPSQCISQYDFVSKIVFACIFFIIAIPMFGIGAFVLFIAIRRNIKSKKLLKHGQLIKDVPCKIIPTNITLNGEPGYIVEVEYQGFKLKSETKFDIDVRRNSADLLIDPLNFKNYYIDFDIVR